MKSRTGLCKDYILNVTSELCFAININEDPSLCAMF